MPLFDATEHLHDLIPVFSHSGPKNGLRTPHIAFALVKWGKFAVYRYMCSELC